MIRILRASLLAATFFAGVPHVYANTTTPLSDCLTAPQKSCVGPLTDEFLSRSSKIVDESRRLLMIQGLVTQLTILKELAAAETVVRLLPDPGMQEKLLGGIATEYANVGDLDNANRILKDLSLPHIIAIVAVAIYEKEASDKAIGQIIEQVEGLQNAGLQLVTYINIAKTLTAAEKLDKAETIIPKVKDERTQALLYINVALKHLEKGRLDDAIAVTNKVKHPCDKIAGLMKMSEKASVSIDHQAGLHLVKLASDHSAKVSRSSLSETCGLVSIAKGFVNFGNVTRALEIAETLENAKDQVNIWAHVLKHNRQTNAIKDESIFIDRIKHAYEITTDDFERHQIISGLIGYYSDADNVDEAIKTITMLKDPQRQARHFEELGVSQIEIGRYDQAETIFNLIKIQGQRAYNLLKIAATMRKNGQLQKAIEKVKMVVGIIPQIEDQSRLDIVNNDLVDFYFLNDEFDNVRATFPKVSEGDYRQATILRFSKLATKEDQVALVRDLVKAEIDLIANGEDYLKPHYFLRLVELPEHLFPTQTVHTLAPLIKDKSERDRFVTGAALMFVQKQRIEEAREIMRVFGTKDAQDEFYLAEITFLLRQASSQ